MEKNNKTLIKTGVSSVLLSSGILLGSSFASDLPFSSIEVAAASTTTYTTTANLNLRSTNSTKGKILLTIPKGKTVNYISKSGTWYKVSYNGKTGWVSSDYIKTTNAVATKTTYTTTANLNLRSTNSTKGSILLTIPKGKAVSYISKSGDWYKVTYNGKTGWVSSKYVKVATANSGTTTKPTTPSKPSTSEPSKPSTNDSATKSTYTTTANLNLRSTNSTKGSILLTIPKGKTVNYISKSGDWYKVTYNGKTGWVSSAYIKATSTNNGTTLKPSTPSTPGTSEPTKPSTPSTPSTNEPSKPSTDDSTVNKIYSTTANLNLRSTNSTAGKILLTIPNGQTVTYISTSGKWYKVQYNGVTGWVSSDYIKISTNNGTSPTNPSTGTGSDNLPPGQTINSMIVYTTNSLNLRTSNSTSSASLGTIPANTKLTSTYKASNGWYKVSYNGKTGFVSGSYLISQSTKARIDSLEANKNSYLFMDLRTVSSVTADQINAYIKDRVGNNRSVLLNSGADFVEVGKKYGVNALYLAAHAIHESNFGKSTIALDRYNLFGYGAYDLVPYLGAVKFDSIKQNIEFIAQKIKATYLGNSWHNQGTYLGYSVKSIAGGRVDSLSKGMNFYYATDEKWGELIARHMTNIMEYSKESAAGSSPNTTPVSNPGYPDLSDVFPTNTLAVAKSAFNLYDKKSGKVVGTMPKGAKFNLLEKDNNYWLTVKYNNRTYYANVSFSSYNKYFTVKNLGRVDAGGSALNVRADASTSAKVITTINHKEYVELALDTKDVPITKNGWYKVKVNGNYGWVSGGYLVRELNR
ncbi:SH3 domain-containing protein [Ureibacillus galli]|nr:SH3 domain-containing protein [Ureibacillus galli]